MRLNKYLADCSVCSRRKADEYITDGKIKINGEIITQMGYQVDAEKDIVEYMGQVVKPEEKFIYLILNKPRGCVTTIKDQFNRKTVMDYVKDVPTRVFPVGRLDYDTSGLLLLTNDGELSNRLAHPKHEVEKVYIARVSGCPTKEELNIFRRGLEISGYRTAPAKIEILESNKYDSVLQITITEGKNRQVRKMCEAISHPVKDLHRISLGPLSLNGLKEGTYRKLSYSEILKLFKYVS